MKSNVIGEIIASIFIGIFVAFLMGKSIIYGAIIGIAITGLLLTILDKLSTPKEKKKVSDVKESDKIETDS